MDRQLISLIFEKFCLSGRYKTVAEELNADNLKTSNNSVFTGQAVSRILKDEKHLSDGTISQDLWDQCQKIIQAKKRRGSTRRVAHLASGLVVCVCGTKLYVPTNSKKYVCSNCLSKVGIADMEAIVVENLKHSDSKEIKQAVALWPTLSFSQKREIIESSISHITLNNKSITVSLLVVE